MTLRPNPDSMFQPSPADIVVLKETSRWNAREVQYIGGTWEKLRNFVPEFEFGAFSVGADEPESPYYQTVVRKPLGPTERPMPVGIVSRTYSLVQHRLIGDRCMAALSSAGIDTSKLRCEVGLSSLGEWMNVRIYFPDAYSFAPNDGQKINLRLEAVNSVDGSSRLTIFLGWYRFVCSNGLVLGKWLLNMSDLHNCSLDLPKMIKRIEAGVRSAQKETKTFEAMESKHVSPAILRSWIENTLAKKWGKKAACRAFHICTSGYDVEILPFFEKLSPVELPFRQTERVPGSPDRAATVYDVCQALSWIATRRSDAEQRIEWQGAIGGLVQPLMEYRQIAGSEPLL